MTKYKEYKQLDLPGLSRDILDYWNSNDIFHKSVSTRKGKPSFVFYEGPPSANGTPGIHHVMARTVKDIFCRYKTLKGFQVERKGGWDTHGLPVELQVEKELDEPLYEVFPTFEPMPVASASLGQVHFATLPDGQEVAVKVFRPGVDKLIEIDLDILLELAALAEKRTDWGEYYGVLSLAQEFADTLRKEATMLPIERYSMQRLGAELSAALRGAPDIPE